MTKSRFSKIYDLEDFPVEEEPVIEEEVEVQVEPVKVTDKMISVRGWWLKLINNQELVEYNGDFRLISKENWRRAKNFEMLESEFKNLKKPVWFELKNVPPDIRDQVRVMLWRTGNVDNLDNVAALKETLSKFPTLKMFHLK